MQRAEYLIRLEAGSAKDIRTSPPADLFDEILELQEDLDEFRSLSAEASAERRQELLEKLQPTARRSKARKAQMENRLLEQFSRWDTLQAEGDSAVQAQKDAVLTGMQEILSNRTYVKNIVNDLEAATSPTAEPGRNIWH